MLVYVFQVMLYLIPLGLVSNLFSLQCILVLLLLQDLPFGFIVFVSLFSSNHVVIISSATATIISFIQSTCFMPISLTVFTYAMLHIYSFVYSSPAFMPCLLSIFLIKHLYSPCASACLSVCTLVCSENHIRGSNKLLYVSHPDRLSNC
ncbi:hypothetical protein ILYODFUR_028019 [Ilyodon furcidens]|uniref:Uncharacterized protein n=1 Tax=Ilyodon furcidens TaxID=33524 RepID=A0ABV0V8E1_9TELE